jgi:catalase (peroxidase I)
MGLIYVNPEGPNEILTHFYQHDIRETLRVWHE